VKKKGVTLIRRTVTVVQSHVAVKHFKVTVKKSEVNVEKSCDFLKKTRKMDDVCGMRGDGRTLRRGEFGI
jgi:hypothetical protein